MLSMSCAGSLSHVSPLSDREIANSVTDLDSNETEDASSDIARTSVKMAEMTLAGDDIHKLREAIENNPHNFWLWYGLCKAHILKGDLDGAVAACEDGLERIPENTAPMTRLQNLYAAKGKYREAIEISERLFTRDPSSLAETCAEIFQNVQCVASSQELAKLTLFLDRCLLTSS
jgi:predicted Zn-dependent protease